MSHEMRTPMNAIIGMTAIALNSDKVERKDYCLGHIKEASAHLLTIINDVLDMTSIQSNEFSLKLAPFDFRNALKSVAQEYIHKISEQKLKFRFSVDKSIPTILVGDSQRLSKVVSNLLSNAIKFSPSEGLVSIHVAHRGTGPDGHLLLFEVEDHGIGIDPAAKENLFRPFGQAESGTSRRFGGTGLGLAISRHLVEMMGGTIGVESEVNVGSKFFFSVTLKEEPADLSDEIIPEEEPDEAEDQPETGQGDGPPVTFLDEDDEKTGQGDGPPVTFLDEDDETLALPLENVTGGPSPCHDRDLSSYRILLAEDIDINREVVLALLEGSGISIDCVTNGLEALEAIKSSSEAYDLVFMDLQMPEMDGLDATRQIRALPDPELSEIPIIAMTANVFKEDIDACMQAGMNDHIGKPISLDGIYHILDKHLPEKT